MKKITVAEYAELKGISKTAVYKKIKSEKLKTITEEKDGKETKFIILDDVAEEIEPEEEDNKPSSTDNKPSSTPFQPNSTADDKPSSTPFQPSSTDDLNPTIAFLQEQIKEKDRQIERLQKATEEKDRQLQEQFNRLTALLGRSQELEALSHRQLTAGEQEPLQDEDITDTADKKPEEPTKKKGFLKRLFGIKD